MLGTAILAKSMVIGELSESGQVGYVESNLQKVVIAPNKDYSDAPTAMDGQLIKVSDLSPKADEIIGGTICGFDYETGEKIEQNIISDFIDTENAVIKMFGNGYALIGSLLVFTEVNEGSGIETGVYAPMEYLEELPSLFTIVWSKETIHPIDRRFIPGAVLPVVEITSAVDEGGLPVGLTKEESDALTTAHKTGLPCIIKFAFNMGEPTTVTATAAKVQGMFIMEIPLYKITIGFTANAQTEYGWAMQMMVES